MNVRLAYDEYWFQEPKNKGKEMESYMHDSTNWWCWRVKVVLVFLRLILPLMVRASMEEIVSIVWRKYNMNVLPE